jgi:hypothetical protein
VFWPVYFNSYRNIEIDPCRVIMPPWVDRPPKNRIGAGIGYNYGVVLRGSTGAKPSEIRRF